MEKATADEQKHRERVAELTRQFEAQEEARAIVRTRRASRLWTPASVEDSGLLSEQLAVPRTRPRFIIDGMMGDGHNVPVEAQYKTGKTTLICNLAADAVDGRDFLGRAMHLPDGARVGWLNAEMERDDFLDYIRPLKVRNADGVALWHRRGRPVPIMDDFVAEQVVKWLTEQEVALLVVDSWRRICTWSGINENRNEEVELLTDRLDAIKSEAGLRGLLMITHTGRTKAEEGEERARGATAFDDWADARWTLTKNSPRDGGGRFLAAEGRLGISFPETALEFDPLHNRISLGEGNRHTALSEALRESVVRAISTRPGMTTTELRAAIGGKNDGHVRRAADAAEAAGEIHHTCRRPNGKYWHRGPRPVDLECTCRSRSGG